MAMPRALSRPLATLLLSLLLLPALSQAQETPQVSLQPPRPVVGEEATLDATGLSEGGEYVFTVEGPDGETREDVLTADDEGTLSHEFAVDAAGDWTLRLRGPGLSATVAFETATEATGEARDAGGQEQSGEEPGTAEQADQSAEGLDEQPADEGAEREVAEQATESEASDEGDGGESTEPGAEGDAPEPEPEGEATGEGDGGESTVNETESEPTGEGDGEAAGPATASEADGEVAEEEPSGEGSGSEGAGEGTSSESTGEGSEDGATDEADAQPAAQPGEPVEVTTDGDSVVGVVDDEERWRLSFPDGSGGTGAVLPDGDAVWVGHGNSLLRLERQSGRVTLRYAMPGRVIRLEQADGGVSVVSEVGGDLRQRIEVGEDGPRSTVRFGVEAEQFEWLRREAQVDEPAERLEMDPTNPWLLLAAGLAAEEAGERERLLEQSLERATTFYDLAGIAQVLYLEGESELAEAAIDGALDDFARRGYYPRLLTSPELHHAYNLPLEPMQSALEAGDLEAAEFWAPWLYLLANEEAPETREALASFAAELERADRSDAAALWRTRARADDSSSPAASLERFFLGLARVGWYGVAAILAAILALHLTLIAKYWAPQSLAMRRRIETGGPARPWSRVFAIRYYSFTEKLVLVLLFAACLTLLGLTRWYDSAGERPEALQAGSLATPVARDLVTSAPLESERGAFIRGFAAHSAGEADTAREEYLAAEDYPPALNNLAAISGDESLYQRALDLAPGMPEPAFNLGRRTDPSRFHAAYRSDQPLLAVPDSGDFRAAVAGSWQNAVASTFENPWRALRGMEFFGMPSLVWQILLALFLLWLLVTVVWLVIPRPGFARNAPRSGAYHLLALLIPGSGLADEAWGVLLMVPWALLGVDALSQWLGWERSLGLALETELWVLGGIYLINLVAFMVELVSYRRRMRELRRRHPEAVEAYGLRNA